eukprot:954334_1
MPDSYIKHSAKQAAKNRIIQRPPPTWDGIRESLKQKETPSVLREAQESRERMKVMFRAQKKKRKISKVKAANQTVTENFAQCFEYSKYSTYLKCLKCSKGFKCSKCYKCSN